MLVEISTAPALPSIPVEWAVIIGITSVALGGGGVAALIKALSDRRAGVESHEVVEDDAITARWKQITESQVTALLEPMQRNLDRLEAKVEVLEAALDTSRRKYWSAIPYIRTLLVWIGRHLPESAPSLPMVPADIAEDLNV